MQPCETLESSLPIPLSFLVIRASCGESADSLSLEQPAQLASSRLHAITQVLCPLTGASACEIPLSPDLGRVERRGGILCLCRFSRHEVGSEGALMGSFARFRQLFAASVGSFARFRRFGADVVGSFAQFFSSRLARSTAILAGGFVSSLSSALVEPSGPGDRTETAHAFMSGVVVDCTCNDWRRKIHPCNEAPDACAHGVKHICSHQCSHGRWLALHSTAIH